jgi:hypothetical protein
MGWNMRWWRKRSKGSETPPAVPREEPPTGPPKVLPEPASPPSTTAPPAPAATTSYSSDQPIKDKGEDRFNRWPFASRIAETLAGRQDPSSLVVGVYGPWGDGKSSVLVMMEEALAEHQHVVRVRFNPWHFGTDEQLLRSFFATLAAALGKSASTKLESAAQALERYGSVLSLASVTIAGGVVSLDPGNAAQGLGKALSTVELDTLRARIEGFLRDSGKRVVVLIDDIDRLDRNEIQTVFKLVKLSANFEYTSYVLAFDDEMVAGALGEKYGAGNAAAGRAFLEKIIQVPLHLPSVDELSLRKLAFEGVDAALAGAGIALSAEQVQAFCHHFVEGIEPQLSTPRQAKLYVNALTFALPILRGEVNPVDQMLVEGIRLFYPKIFGAICDNPEYFLATRLHADAASFKERVQKAVSDACAGAGVTDSDGVRDLLQLLFPRLKSVFGNYVFGDDWDDVWEREQRVCSDAYFQRYFRYAVPTGDVPDRKVDELLNALADGQAVEGERLFGALAATENMEKLIRKLRRRETTMPPAPAARLAAIVASNGALLPRDKAMMLSDWTFMQAGILVAHLVRQLPLGSAREELAMLLVRGAEPLRFALECFRWMRKGDDVPDEDRLLSASVEDELGRAIADRVRDAAGQAPLYTTFGGDAPNLYWVWRKYGEAAAIAEHLAGRFREDDSEADAFLGSFVGLSWGIESGLSQPAAFGRSHYDAVAGLIDPEVVLAALRPRYGTWLDKPRFHPPGETPLPQRVAEQFAAVHKKVQQETNERDAQAAAAAQPPAVPPSATS